MAHINTSIENSWSLISFAQANGNPRLKKWNKKDGSGSFSALNFVRPGLNSEGLHDVCMVSFSKSLGEMTIPEIIAKKNDLQVVKQRYTDDQTGEIGYAFILCNAGSVDFGEEFSL